MKRLGLSPHLCAATLFLVLGLRGEEAKPTPLPPVSAPTPTDRADANKAEVERRFALRAELVKLFDRNDDGKLDAAEMAVVGAFLADGSISGISTAVVVNPTPAEEKTRLERVAEEVARRRELREKAQAAMGTPRPGIASQDLEEALRAARAEVRRLESVAAEVARRRAEREKANATSDAK